MVQNFVARVVLGLKKFDDISQGRRSLKWLDVKEKVLFNDLVLVFKCVNGFGKCLTTRRRLGEIASLVYSTSLFYCLINQSEFAVAIVRRGEQNGVIVAGVPFLLSPIPSPFLPPSFFSFFPNPFDACYAGYVW